MARRVNSLFRLRQRGKSQLTKTTKKYRMQAGRVLLIASAVQFYLGLVEFAGTKAAMPAIWHGVGYVVLAALIGWIQKRTNWDSIEVPAKYSWPLIGIVTVAALATTLYLARRALSN